MTHGCLLYGQLSGAASLWEIVGGLESHAVRLYHVGARPVSRSTLADANAQRPSTVFSGLFSAMVSQAQRGLRRAVGEATHLIDSTGIRLSGLGAAWAHFSAKACGAKVHVIYDPDADRPVYAAVTAAKVNDITAAQTMPILCNDLDATAQEIADLHTRRWAIELFFRWVKQTLKIRHFLGTSENAVRIQVAVALIAFLLLRMAQTAQKAVESPLAFARLVRANLMHRKRIDRLIGDDPKPRIDPNQMRLQWP